MTEQLLTLEMSQIIPNPYQPRLEFSDEELAELAQSIKENGLIQPIIVRQSPIAGYELVAGERRFRASQLAGLTEILALVKDISDDDSMKQAILENLQRSDLNPIEEALAYQKLLDKQNMTHDEIAQIMGKSRPYISNSLRLLTLSENCQKALVNKLISPGHARLLLSLDKDKQEQWLAALLEKEWTVRQLEQQLKTRKKARPQKNDLFIQEQEKQLKQSLGLDCQLRVNASGQGQLKINFSTLEDIHNLINKLL